MGYTVYKKEVTQDLGLVDVLLVEPPPDGTKGFIHLKDTLGLAYNAAELYKKSKSLPCAIMEKVYFGGAEKLVSYLKNPEIVQIVKRADSIVTTIIETRVPDEALNIPPLPGLLADFIKLGIEFSYIMPLPWHYADTSDFVKMQEGYRYNPVSGEFLVSEKAGEWQPGWYVFARNYFDDPFFIDFTEEAQGFPVYFSYHGSGKWEPIKIADSLASFAEILKTLKGKDEPDQPFELAALLPELDLLNEFWAEVAGTCREMGTA
ncbi:MAG: SMI1/KNR4 family protein [Spirochaetes bacterium]|nr:SMI1/KNR4 family protein [Spirochaetota bacterium]